MPARSAIAVVCLMLLVVTSATASSAVAQTRDKAREPDRDRVDRQPDRDSRASDSHRALSDAVRRVERRTGGQVLSAERVPYDGRDVNRVKIVDSSGRVRVYVDDPSRTNGDAAAGGRPVSLPRPTRRDDN